MAVQPKDYLTQTIDIANEEKEILDCLAAKHGLSKIEIRAAKNSLQVIIENAIGKAKKILKYYNCPLVPHRNKDSIYFLYEVGAINDDEYRSLSSAIGFRNSMIHDYMQFNIDVLLKILKEKKYLDVYNFLISDINYGDVVIKRIENFLA